MSNPVRLEAKYLVMGAWGMIALQLAAAGGMAWLVYKLVIDYVHYFPVIGVLLPTVFLLLGVRATRGYVQLVEKADLSDGRRLLDSLRDGFTPVSMMLMTAGIILSNIYRGGRLVSPLILVGLYGLVHYIIAWIVTSRDNLLQQANIMEEGQTLLGGLEDDDPNYLVRHVHDTWSRIEVAVAKTEIRSARHSLSELQQLVAKARIDYASVEEQQERATRALREMKDIRLGEDWAAHLTTASQAQKEGRLDEAVWTLLDLERGLEELRQRHRRLTQRIEELHKNDTNPAGLVDLEDELRSTKFSSADELRPLEQKLDAILEAGD